MRPPKRSSNVSDKVQITPHKAAPVHRRSWRQMSPTTGGSSEARCCLSLERAQQASWTFQQRWPSNCRCRPGDRARSLKERREILPIPGHLFAKVGRQRRQVPHGRRSIPKPPSLPGGKVQRDLRAVAGEAQTSAAGLPCCGVASDEGNPSRSLSLLGGPLAGHVRGIESRDRPPLLVKERRLVHR